jgi:hypothetical protein
MTLHGRELGAAIACAVALPLIAAPAALAGRVDYAVPAGAGYTVKATGHGNGVVKVTYTSCLTPGETVRLPVQVTPRGPTHDGPIAATWKVIKDGDATLAFDPATVTFDGATESAVLAITPGAATAKGVFLRFKLDPANGSGLGEGPGVMVRVACVVNPAPAVREQPGCPPAGPPHPGQARGREVTPAGDRGNAKDKGKGNDDRVSLPDDELTPLDCSVAQVAPAAAAPGPTAATFPAVAAEQAQGNAPCVATPKRLRIHRDEQTTLRVTVNPNGIPVRGSFVRVTTPDGTITKRTDSRGLAFFRIRPRRGGRVVIQADACFGADRVGVLAARASSRSAARPRFTG